MNKAELVQAVREATELTKKDSEKAVTAVFNIIEEQLAKGGSVGILGFGTFEVRERAERNGKNPQTGEAIVIPACKAPAFKAGKALKNAVN